MGNLVLPDAKWPSCLLKPVGDATLFVGEELKIGAVTKRAFEALIATRPLLQLAMTAFQRLGNVKAVKAVQAVLAEQVLQEKWAKDTRDAGFTSLNRHLFVAGWSALEAALEETAVLLLMNDRTSFQGLTELGVKPPPGCNFPPDEFDARRMFRSSWSIGPKERVFSARLTRTFAALGLPLELSVNLSGQLDEVNTVRNLVLHRQGRVDPLAAARSPALVPLLGSTVEITTERWRTYNEAMNQLNAHLHRSVGTYLKRAMAPGQLSDPG